MYALLLILLLGSPLLLSFLVPVLVLRKAHATFDSKKSLYKRLAIYALAPSLLTSLFMYVYANVYHNDMLSVPTFMMLFLLIYVGSLFTIWLFLPKTHMHIGLKIVCWALRVVPIVIYLIISVLLLVMLSFPAQN